LLLVTADCQKKLRHAKKSDATFLRFSSLRSWKANVSQGFGESTLRRTGKGIKTADNGAFAAVPDDCLSP